MRGLDISSYQDGINFNMIKESGINFLILRAGFTGWGTGKNYNKDKCFEEFYNKAKLHNIYVGAYWFSCANTYELGCKEAEFMYENCLKGKQFEFPIYIDVEDTHHQLGNKQGTTDAIKGFCETLEKLGYYVGVYANLDWFNNHINTNDILQFDKWLAQWTNTPSTKYSYGLWQNSNNGIIGSMIVDTDISYVDYPKIIKENGFNGYSTPSLKYLNLSSQADTWRFYDLGVTPIKEYAKGMLKPSKFGGLSYTILGYEDNGGTAIINTSQFGKVKVYILHNLASVTDTPLYELVN